MTDVAGLGLSVFWFVVVVCVRIFVDNNDDLIWIQSLDIFGIIGDVSNRWKKKLEIKCNGFPCSNSPVK